jgi:hypothetical protein
LHVGGVTGVGFTGKERAMRGVLIATATLVWLTAVPAGGQIFDVAFNELSPGPALTQLATEPQPLRRPTNVVLDFPDEGDTIEIVTEAGDLVDQPVLLDAVPGGISWGGFLTPSVHSGGAFSISWDSLVLDSLASEEPPPDVGLHVVTWHGDPGTPSQLAIQERWEIRYTPEGTFEILDADGPRTAGAYAVGQANHFDLAFDLDSGRWELAVDGDNLLDGFLLTPFEFGGVVFLTNGRGRTADPPAMAMDNLLMREVSDLPDLIGDYSGNGLVEQADLDLVLAYWGAPATPVPDGWSSDPPAGFVDQDELDRVLVNWGSLPASAAAPEPSAVALALLLVCLAALGARRLTKS